jgi:hypothetical protein
MVNRRKRQRNMNPDLEKWIKRKARRGESPIDIFREMQKSDEWKDIENLPILRTVQSVVKDQKIQDKTAPWSVGDEEFSAEDARLILDVFADVIVFFGEERVFTRAEAAWVLKMRKLAPGLPLPEVWDLARSYMVIESKGDSTEATDAYLAFKPWMSKNRLEHYEYALKVGCIKEDPDRGWELDRMKRDMESHQALPTSALDGDPSVVHPEIWWLEHEGPGALDEMTRIDRIGKQNPELGKRIKKVWDDAHQQYVDLTKKRGEKAKLQGDLRVSWIKYKALLNSFETEAS